MLPAEPPDPGRLPGNAGAARASRRPGPSPRAWWAGGVPRHGAPGPAPTGSPVPALGPWASHSPSDPVFQGGAGLGGSAPRASGVLGSDVGGGWERHARPQGPPMAREAGRSGLLCAVGRARPAAEPTEAQPCNLHAGHCGAPQPRLLSPRAHGPDPAQPASLAHPPEAQTESATPA